MAKQKRLNKNLVAFLTIMGIIVIVSVAALVVRQQARRDPEVLARSARDSRRAGDLDEAARRFLQAWVASEQRDAPNTQYLIDAAACRYEMGELDSWHSLLEAGSAKVPGDTSLRLAMLDGLWRMLDIAGGVIWADAWRVAGEKLTELDPSNTLAMVSTARGLWDLKGGENEATADRLVQKAFEQAPRDPRVVATYIVYLQRRAKAELDDLFRAGGRAIDADRINRKFAADVMSVMGPAVDEHPENVFLVTGYTDYLQFEARRVDQEGDTAQAAELYAKAGDALRRSVEARADEPSPDLYLALAQHEREVFGRAHPKLAAAEAAPFHDELAQIDSHAQRAIELDAAMYEAYTTRAELVQRFGFGLEGTDVSAGERLDKSLALLESAKGSTLTLRSLRARLRWTDRLRMLRASFDLAMAYELQGGAGGRGGAPTLARAEAFLEEARTRYPDQPLTLYMQGQMEIAKSDAVAAIATLQKAYQKSEQTPTAQARGQARFWLAEARVGRLPSEQLALLYAQRSQFGEAKLWAEKAMNEYRFAGAVPPAMLVATFAEMLRQIGEAQNGLAVLDEYRDRYPDEQSVAAVRVRLLEDLKRTDDAKKALEGVPGTGAATDIWVGQRAADQGDYARAEQLLRGVLKDTDASDEQFREALLRLVDVLDRAHRRLDARQLVQQLKADPPRGGLRYLLERMELELAADDPAALTPEQRQELDAKRIELIKQTPNALARNQEFYQFYASRSDWAQALPYLEEIRKQVPTDMRLVEEEFHVRLLLRQFEKVNELLAKLSEGVGLDHAGGAIYRGDLALAKETKEDAAKAITEYRQAEQQMQVKSDDLEIKLARACLIAGRTTEGIEALKQAAKLNPRSFEAQRLLREVYRQAAGQGFGTDRTENERLAEEAQARATELAPDNPYVKAWNEETAEEHDPLKAVAERDKRRAANPGDTKNLKRIGELLVRAWRQAADGTDEAARQKAIEAADRFFPDAIFAQSGEVQSSLARAAAEFYSLAKRADQGAGLLRRLIEQRSGEGRVEVQVLLAMFFEALPNPDAAEREYVQAQRLVREVAQDETTRRRLDLNVGMALIRFHQRQRRADKVAEACRWLLDRLGSDASQAATAQQVRLMLIEALYSSGQLADAEAEIRDYLKLYPDDVSGLSARAQLNMRKKERKAALEDLTRVLEMRPDNVLALYSRGRLALEQGKYDKAREDLVLAEKLIASEPRLEIDIRRQLASLYARTRQFDLAADQLKTLLDVMEAQGGSPEQKQLIVRQWARLLYDSMGQFDRAQRLISEYMEKHPAEALWPFELGRLFERQGADADVDARSAKARGDSAKERERKDAARQSYSSAVTYYQRAAERAGERNAKDKIASLIARLGAMNRAGRGAEVLETFNKTDFSQMPDQFRTEARARMATEAAKAQEAAGAKDAARQLWLEALRAACGQNIALIGDVAADLRDTYRERLPEAEAILRQMLEGAAATDLCGQRGRIILATHLCLTGNPAGALPVLAETQGQLARGSPDQLSALLTRAQAQDMTGDREGAVRTYKELLVDYQDNLTALNNLAYTLVDVAPPLYAPLEALKYAERLRSLLVPGENVGTMLDTIGWVYFRNNDLDLALSALEEAFSAGGASAAVCQHLAQVYQKLNRIADARNVVNQGLDVARHTGDAATARQLEELRDQLK